MKKFKIVKEDLFKNFKVKPAVITATILVGGLLIGGFGTKTIVNIANSQNHTTVPIESSIDSNNQNKDNDSLADTIITSINGYKFNINEFDEVITASFESDAQNDTFGIDDITVNANDSYTINTDDGDVLSTSFDNAILTDSDFTKRKDSELSKDLGNYSDAIVNFYDELESVSLNALSFEKINDKNMYVFDTENERMLTSLENAAPYRKITEAESEAYDYDDIFLAYIVLDGKLITLDHFVGYRDITVDDQQYRIVCALVNGDTFCEYLTVKEQTIFLRKTNGVKERVKGVELDYGKSVGNFNHTYEELTPLYRDVEAITLKDDNMYQIMTTDGIEITVSPKYYSLDYREGEVDFKVDENAVALGDYNFLVYNKRSYEYPSYIDNRTRLAKVNDTYLYLVGSNGSYDQESPRATEYNYGSIYSPNAMELDRIIPFEEIGNDYTMVSGDLSYVSNFSNNKMGVFSPDQIESANMTLYAYKQTNIYGLNYYSIIVELHSNKDNVTTYIEMLMPMENVIVKGSEEKMGPTKVLK